MVTPIVPGFEDLELVGSGGYGTVYRARQSQLDREVALKTLTVESREAAARDTLLREAKLAASVSQHPNIVTVHDTTFTADGRLCLVMEWCPGGTLVDEVTSSGPLDLDRVLDMGIKLASGLDAAHRSGMVHRDIKPGNVLLSAYGQPALSDFGTATMVSDSTASGDLRSFTLHYAAPEVLDDQPVTAAADLYSLCATLFFAATGRRPFDGDQTLSIEQLIARIISGSPATLVSYGLPDSLSDLVQRALEKDPLRRPASARVIAEELQAIQAELGFSATPVVSPAAAAAVVGLAGDDTTSHPDLSATQMVGAVATEQKRSKRPLIVGAVAAVAVAGLVGASVWAGISGFGSGGVSSEDAGQVRPDDQAPAGPQQEQVGILANSDQALADRPPSIVSTEGGAAATQQTSSLESGPVTDSASGSDTGSVSGSGSGSGTTILTPARDSGSTGPSTEVATASTVVGSSSTSRDSAPTTRSATSSTRLPTTSTTPTTRRSTVVGPSSTSRATTSTTRSTTSTTRRTTSTTRPTTSTTRPTTSTTRRTTSTTRPTTSTTRPRTTPTTPSTSTSTTVAGISCSEWYLPSRSEQVSPYQMTSTDRYNVRRAPKSDPACQRDSFLPAGATVTVQAERGSWRYVHDELTNDLGWVHANVLTSGPPPSEVQQPVRCSEWYLPSRSEQVNPYQATSTDRYNMRRAPAPDSACQRNYFLPAGATVTVHAKRDGFLYTSDALTGDWGWIHSDFLTGG